MVDSYEGVDGETGGGYFPIVFFYFLFVLLYFGLSCPGSFLSE